MLQRIIGTFNFFQVGFSDLLLSFCFYGIIKKRKNALLSAALLSICLVCRKFQLSSLRLYTAAAVYMYKFSDFSVEKRFFTAFYLVSFFAKHASHLYPLPASPTTNYYSKRGSACCGALGERGRERERERKTGRQTDRRKWRHHCRAEIGDEFTLSIGKTTTEVEVLQLRIKRQAIQLFQVFPCRFFFSQSEDLGQFCPGRLFSISALNIAQESGNDSAQNSVRRKFSLWKKFCSNSAHPINPRAFDSAHYSNNTLRLPTGDYINTKNYWK